jgi:hypothetical protein
MIGWLLLLIVLWVVVDAIVGWGPLSSRGMTVRRKAARKLPDEYIATGLDKACGCGSLDWFAVAPGDDPEPGNTVTELRPPPPTEPRVWCKQCWPYAGNQAAKGKRGVASQKQN